MKKKELEIDKKILNEFIKNLQDKEKIIELCNNLQIKDSENLSIEELYYCIIEKVEKNSDVLEYFKKLAEEDNKLKELFPYFKDTKNIRFFIDNKEKYNLKYEDIEKMQIELKKRYEKKRKAIFTVNIKYPGIWIFIMVLSLISFHIIYSMPYFVTQITDSAIIVEAKVLEEKREISGLRGGGVHTKVKYEYYVDGKRYINSDIWTVYGIEDNVNLRDYKVIEIYYFKNNPQKSYIYNFSKFIFIYLIIAEILFLISIISYIRKKK